MRSKVPQGVLHHLRVPGWRPYVVAVLIVAVLTALKLRTSVAFGEADANLAYLAGVMIAGWLGGFGPAMTASILSVLAANYFFMAPRFAFAGTLDQALVQLATFAEGTIIAILCETMRRAQRSASLAAVEARTHSEQLQANSVELTRANDELRRLMVEQETTQERLREVHKMEALGRLAGGVAHDFNNLLSVINSFGEMLLEDSAPGSSHREDVGEILNAGRRATALTQQLLTFSRKRVVTVRPIDLASALPELKTMLHRLIGASVALDFQTPTQPATIIADPTQIEQVLVNLVVNARDSMPEGGTIKVEVEVLAFADPRAHGFGTLASGDYVVLRVTDSGMGMDAATQKRIFEPFFTTKAGNGTGIGLATVLGIVQQCGGAIHVRSEIGAGTTFEVAFPATVSAAAIAKPAAAVVARGNDELILLVEDEDAVRRSASAILRRGGYRVLEASNAGEALLLCEEHAEHIHLVLTDVVMPHVSGPRLAQRIWASFADIPVLFMSGYPDDDAFRLTVTQAPLLQKPFSPQSLSHAVRDALDSSRASTSGTRTKTTTTLTG